MHNEFQHNVNVKEFIAFQFGADVEQRRVKGRLTVLDQKVFHAGNELADVA